MTVPEITPSGRSGFAVLGRVARRLRRLGVAAAKGIAAAVVAVLVLVGAIEGGVDMIACLVLVGAAAAVIGYEYQVRRRPTPLSSAERREVAHGVAFAAVVVLAVAGSVELAGMPVGVLVAALAAVVAVRRTRRRCSAPAEAVPPAPPPTANAIAFPRVGGRFVPPAAGRLDRRSTAELVHAWRHSYLLLAASRGDPIRLAHISEQRREYLDELARRDPVGFRRWMDSGARAASDPSRYLTVDPRSRGCA